MHLKLHGAPLVLFSVNLAPLTFSSLEPLLAIETAWRPSRHIDLTFFLSFFFLAPSFFPFFFLIPFFSSFSSFLPSLFLFLSFFSFFLRPFGDPGGPRPPKPPPRYAPATHARSDNECPIIPLSLHAPLLSNMQHMHDQTTSVQLSYSSRLSMLYKSQLNLAVLVR